MTFRPETSAITAGRPEVAPDASLNPPIVIMLVVQLVMDDTEMKVGAR
jgi:hypothetical protein